ARVGTVDADSSQRVRLLVNNNILATVDVSNTYQEFSFLVDARGFSGNITFALQGYSGSLGVTGRNFYIRSRRVHQNEQLPIRWGRPVYTVGEGPSGCYVGCEVSCQGSCQYTC